MKKLVLTSLILVSALGCKNSFATRMTSNYFPLKTRNTWVYDVQGENNYRTEVVVIQMEITGGDTLFLVDMGGEIQYFQRQSAIANRVRELSTNYEGDKVTFGTIYEPYLLLPPIEGEDWEREFNFSLEYMGETLEKNFSISVDSVISTSLVINSENYENVYRLKRTVVEDNVSIVEYEWFAPNIGLIRKEIPADSSVWEIVSFDFNE